MNKTLTLQNTRLGTIGRVYFYLQQAQILYGVIAKLYLSKQY